MPFAVKVRSKHCQFFVRVNLLFKRFIILGRLLNCQKKRSFLLECFVCHLCGKSSNSENQADINQLRCSIYYQKWVKVETLTPYQNVLRQHMKIYIWRKSLENFVSEDSPVNHGWFINNDQLDILWMTCKPAPDIAGLTNIT